MTPCHVAVIDIALTHPAFEGHFPGRPVLPGALLLAEAMQALRVVPVFAARLGEQPVLEVAKFQAPVVPGSRVELRVFDESARLRFELWQRDALVASGRWATPRAASNERTPP